MGPLRYRTNAWQQAMVALNAADGSLMARPQQRHELVATRDCKKR